MIGIKIYGWREGLRKVSLTKLQTELLHLPLKEAKENVDQLLASSQLLLEAEDSSVAAQFIKQAQVLGANCRLGYVSSMRVPVQNHSPHPLPEYQTAHAAGLDLRAHLPDAPVTLGPLERQLIPTGLHLEIPVGYEGQVRPRSGLAVKHGIGIVNSPGTIDADYRGEVRVLLVNLSNAPFTVHDGDRIAQLIIARHEVIEWQPVEILSETGRGAGGYGSTGK